MNNLIKKVLLASAVALAALGSPLSKPAQAQTPTPTPKWKVYIRPVVTPTPLPGITPIPLQYKTASNIGMAVAPYGTTPSDYLNQNVGLNGQAVGATVNEIIYSASDTDCGQAQSQSDGWRNDIDFQAVFAWDGAAADCPNTIDVQETVTADASVSKKARGSLPSSYGSAIDFQAYFSGLPSGVTPTVNSGAYNKSAQAIFTTTLTVDKSSLPYRVIVPVRHAHSDLLIDWSLYGSPALTASQKPGECQSIVSYSANLSPFYPQNP